MADMQNRRKTRFENTMAVKAPFVSRNMSQQDHESW